MAVERLEGGGDSGPKARSAARVLLANRRAERIRIAVFLRDNLPSIARPPAIQAAQPKR